jgi:predicted Zn finger-like uncharacterized protein
MALPAADTEGRGNAFIRWEPAMTFECSNCQLRYRIDDALIPPDGARVKCRRCSALIEVPAPVIELAPVDLELIPPPPPKRPLRVEEPSVDEPVERPARAPRVADPDPETVDEGVTLEQQLAAEARSVPPSPDIEHDSFVERFDAPPSSEIPRDPGFEHIGHSAAQASYAAAEPRASARETAPIGTPTLEAAPGLPSTPEPALEAHQPYEPASDSGPPSLGEPSLELSPSEPSLGAPPLAAPPLEFAPPLQSASSLESAPPVLGAPVLEANPPQSDARPPAPSLAAPETTQAEAPMAVDNVVPLTMGTPIPEGLSPEERTRHEKARRLARVLASDIAIYNREKKERGIVEGNLVAVLGYEIKKSWETYKERVGADFANSTPYFRDALNDLLAEGKKIF